MRNVKIYNSFLKNINYSFKIRFLKISLMRTYIFNFDNNDTYYRKANVIRKIALKGKERAMLLDKKLDFNFDLSKVGISKIDRIVSEYVSCDLIGSGFSEDSFDVIGKDKKKIVTSDSVISKIRRDEIVSMCFDDEMLSNVLLLNKNKNYDYYINI